MLINPHEASRRILAGEQLLLAADEDVLLALPPGNWIGGTTPYFMAESGGMVSRDAIFATALPPEVVLSQIVTYDVDTIHNICTDTPENGITFIIIPASSRIHIEFAQNAPDFDQMYARPLMGWIAGVHLDDLSWKAAKVFDGRTVSEHMNKAVALHGSLAPGKSAHLGIINLFCQGEGDTFVFPHIGFDVKECLVNGQPQNFASYLLANKIDTRIPMIDSYSGSNVSFQSIDEEQEIVHLYAPVFPDTEYRIAEPVTDYLKDFHAAIPKGLRTDFSCNCILNFLYSELEGKVTSGVSGPVTFGEIAYQLLNQTLVYLSINDTAQEQIG